MNNKTKQMSGEVSPLIVSDAQNGCGIMGFTIRHEDGSFENIMQEFTALNRESVQAEMTGKMEKAMQQKQQNKLTPKE